MPHGQQHGNELGDDGGDGHAGDSHFENRHKQKVQRDVGAAGDY